MISRVHCPIQLSVAKFLNVFFLGTVAKNVGQGKNLCKQDISAPAGTPRQNGCLEATSPPPPILNGPQLLPNPPSSFIFNKGPLNRCFFGRVFCDMPPTHPTIMTKILQSPQNLQSAHCLCNSPHGAPWPNSALHCHQCLILFLPHSIFVRCLHSLNGKDLR